MGLELFHLSADCVCAHAGVDLEGQLRSRDPDVFVWGVGGFPEQYSGRHRVIYGHWDNAVDDADGWPRPAIRANGTFGIDTIRKGVLTAIRLPDGAAFQSKRYS